MTFNEKLKAAVQTADSTLCVGLDPNLDLMPNPITSSEQSDSQKVEQFLKKVIDVTEEHCAAYKPNLGFFEALGASGWDTFEAILNYIPDDKIIIADAKRGDISSTAEHYAKAFFKKFEVDAVTLNPLMGFETLEPFLDDVSKGIYVLTLTSNPGAKDILLKKLAGGQTISGFIAKELNRKQKDNKTSIGMVMGATKANKLEPVINKFPTSPLLIPGVGKQGGSIKALSKSLEQHSGTPLINSSRSIIYAGNNEINWHRQVAEAAKNYQLRLAPITQRYV
ncbi:orotidine-5'-phosphate decarboxylase [Aliifodinibius salipaludis]|uniref:Orotidine-5'-phosphate decarboxylase n=1 Tax=Fodinibius salipaludis TaxID=2032627 RepID=A0A2A2G617_9BACT|nr:orotidine-5'-phosphate decarboxylase [Aliifodinibius salipaludis]PAU93071.1 orotidine-5'-phosphate decarboxylase [Aliifodinibius salipaludis]